MNFLMAVGETQKYLLEYTSSGRLGSASIRIDNEVVHEFRLFSGRKVLNFDLGNNERLNLRFEIERHLLGREKCTVFVNGRLVKLYDDTKVESCRELKTQQNQIIGSR